MKDCHDLYLRCYVLSSAEVFNVMVFDVMVCDLLNKVKLDLISDVDMYLFLVKPYLSVNLDKYDGEVNLEYFKELHELHNGYPFVLNKLEIKGEMLFDYQLKIADDDNISIGNVKN